MSLIEGQRHAEAHRRGPAVDSFTGVGPPATGPGAPQATSQAGRERRPAGRSRSTKCATIVIGAAAALLAAGGAVGAHRAGDAWRVIATLVVGCLALTYALVGASSIRPSDADGRRRAAAAAAREAAGLPRFIDQALLALVVLAIISLVTHSFERSAAELLLAAPVGLTLYSAIGMVSGSPSSDVRRCLRAGACGAAAALFSSQALGTERVETPLLAGLVLLAVLGLIVVRRTHRRSASGSAVPAQAWLIGGAIAALATGIAANALALIAVSAPVVLGSRWWRRSSPADFDSPVSVDHGSGRSSG